jgi:LPS sulfotransferase NodH
MRAEPEGSRFLIFAQGRTGSTLLVELLDCHPRIVCDGEIFSPSQFGRIRNLDRHLRGSIGMAAAAGSHYGFKVKPYELTHHGVEVRTFLEQRAADGWAIVHLARTNFIRHALSSDMSEQRGRAHIDVGSAAAAAEISRVYRVDPTQIVDSARGRRQLLLGERRALVGIGHHSVEYERDLADALAHQGTADAIFQYLGLPPSPISARLARLNPDDLSTKITNYEELLAAVDASEFAGMLEPVRS